MDGFFTMLKMNLKLLLRNKGYLCFVVLLPVLAVLLLNIPQVVSVNAEENIDYSVIELDNKDGKLLNMVNIKLMVKVYDASSSVITDYMLQQLVDSGAYDIFRYKDSNIQEEDVREWGVEDMNRNTVTAVIYVGDKFEEELLQGNIGDSVCFFTGPEDERVELLENNINALLDSFAGMMEAAGSINALEDMLKQQEEYKMEKRVINVENAGEKSLNAAQIAQSSNIGYTLAVVTMAFLYGGVFIAQIVMKEKENRVWTRIQLTNANSISYTLVKIILSVFTVIIQSILMGIGILLFVKTDFGISTWSYLYFVCLTGIVFNLLAMVIGILTDNQLSASYIAFFIWSISCCVAGLYFPISATSQWWQKLSLAMPQRWIIKSAEMLMTGQEGVYGSFTLIMLGFMIVIGCLGGIGMKIMKKN